jgi:hypothetical protein
MINNKTRNKLRISELEEEPENTFYGIEQSSATLNAVVMTEFQLCKRFDNNYL